MRLRVEAFEDGEVEEEGEFEMEEGAEAEQRAGQSREEERAPTHTRWYRMGARALGELGELGLERVGSKWERWSIRVSGLFPLTSPSLSTVGPLFVYPWRWTRYRRQAWERERG